MKNLIVFLALLQMFCVGILALSIGREMKNDRSLLLMLNGSLLDHRAASMRECKEQNP